MKVKVFRTLNGKQNGEEYLLLVGRKDGGQVRWIGQLPRISMYAADRKASLTIEVSEDEVPIRCVRYIRHGQKSGPCEFFLLEEDDDGDIVRGPDLVRTSSGTLKAPDGREWHF